VARYPLSGPLSATALRALSAPAPRVAYRSTGYYEAGETGHRSRKIVIFWDLSQKIGNLMGVFGP